VTGPPPSDPGDIKAGGYADAVAPYAGAAAPLALAEPTRRVGFRWVATLTLAYLSVFLGFFTPIQILLPLQVEAMDPAQKEIALSWVLGAGAAVALVANPLFGALSDRTTGRWGRRHPWTIGGALVGAGALAFISGQRTVIGLVVGWCVVQAALNAVLASTTAGVPDHVPARQRAAVSGWLGIPQSAGLIVGGLLVTMVVTGTAAGYLAVAVLVAVLVMPFVFLTADHPLPRTHREPFAWPTFLRGFWISPRRYPDFAWAWITRFLVSFANALGTLYLLFFLRDRVGHPNPDEGVFVLVLLYTVGVAATAVVGGVLSDRLGRRKVLVSVSSAICSVAAVILAMTPTWTGTMVAATIFGAGWGAYLAVDQALITQVLPGAGSRARDLGVINIANSGPQVLAPALAGPIVVHLGGYPTLYALTAAAAILGGVLIWRIRGVP
jgi:MFS family permease